MDFLDTARSSNEEKYLEYIATFLHAEDLGHPRSDPFKMLRRLDDPYEDDATSGAGSVRIAGDECTDMRYLMRDTDTSGEKHHCAIRIEILAAYKMVLV